MGRAEKNNDEVRSARGERREEELCWTVRQRNAGRAGAHEALELEKVVSCRNDDLWRRTKSQRDRAKSRVLQVLRLWCPCQRGQAVLAALSSVAEAGSGRSQERSWMLLWDVPETHSRNSEHKEGKDIRDERANAPRQNIDVRHG